MAETAEDLHLRLEKLEELRTLEVARVTGRNPWVPMPHQVPPPEGWYLWLLLAGRGAGKTDSCASYFDKFMRYNPGYRGAIIAPTLGDAVEACVVGHSGLQSHNPTVKMVQRVGGTIVKWPNGSEAKLFGAYTKEDVERLRAGGNRHIVWCLSEGTPVLTDSGEQPIETVRPGDLVMTREGLAAVTAAERTGYRQLWRLETAGGRMLEATADHPVLTAGGWSRMDSLVEGDILTAWITSPTTGSAGTSGRTATTPPHVEDYSTGTSGSERSGRYRKDSSSITATATRPTTRSATSNSSRASSTPRTTQLRPRGLNAIVRRCGPGHAKLRSTASSAWSAATRSWRSGKRRSTARRRVVTSAGGHRPRWSAPNAGRPSLDARISRGAFAADTVARCEPTGREGWVWDLAVEGQHEFVANGILVHNCEELAAWRNLKEAWENMEFGLRLGEWPHIIASTTPKPRPVLKQLMGADSTVVTRASMYDNPHLPDAQKDRLRAKYAGTRLEAQELLGEYTDDVEGALWTYEMVEANRLGEHPDLVRVVVAVDPSGGDEDGNDEQGIVVVGRGVDQHAYVVADRSCKLSPDGWGKRAVHAYDEFHGDVIVGETNFGGDLVIQNVKVAARDLKVTVNVKKVNASRGKKVRAEPISALYEQGKVHHVGVFEELESQMRNWTQDSGWSPDRMDALVWALTELMLRQPLGQARGSVPRGRIPVSSTGATR